MTATLMDVLMIISVSLVSGTGAGLLIGFAAGRHRRDWGSMRKNDRLIALLLILACSAVIAGALSWYLFMRPPAA